MAHLAWLGKAIADDITPSLQQAKPTILFERRLQEPRSANEMEARTLPATR